MKHPESEIQRSIIKHVRILYPDALIFAIPNGGKRNLREAAILKAEGVLAGVSDLVLIHNGDVHFIEVKAAKNTQTPHQKYFQELITKQGLPYHLVRSVESVIEIINNKK